jgi:exosome complex exonuclease RRP6
MLRYAREDTHYLLYIYDLLRKELLDKGLQSSPSNPQHYLRQVYHKSAGLCLKTYEKPVVKDYNYYMIVGRNRSLQSLAQFKALKSLIKWRDYIARVEDESVGYVMPNHVMF